MGVDRILNQVKQYNTRHITVTGGEPLAQKSCLALLNQLCDLDYDVSLETSGAVFVDQVDKRVVKVIDVKTPASKEEGKNKFENFAFLNAQDQVKFVICDESDYRWSRQLVEKYKLESKCEILFSPSHDQLDALILANWILEDKLNVRFQIQLHKYLWGDKPGV